LVHAGALEAEEAKGEGKDQGASDEHTGILSAMASKIGMAMSAANGNGNHGTEDASKTSNGHAADVSSGEEKGGDANGGGILNTVASKIGMAMSGANGDANHGGSGVNAKTSNGNSVDASMDEKRSEMNGGGILSAVASKIGMANGSGNHSTEGDAKKNNGDAVNGSKGEEEKEKGHDANGAGIVEQIISNLPSGISATSL